jgi:hypothetical protein
MNYYKKGFRYDWPASLELKDCAREVTWPPKQFFHVAGNAQHNRDGTRQVLEAAKYLDGTGTELLLYHSFDVKSVFGEHQGPIRYMGSFDSRADLFKVGDVMLCPRGLAGHSLPVWEAAACNIPCITLDMPDWNQFPYRVKPYPAGENLRAHLTVPLMRADPAELGHLMREMAAGNVERLAGPTVPTWREFSHAWEARLAGVIYPKQETC